MATDKIIPDDAPELLNATQIAGYLGVSIMCIHRWGWKGKMPAPLRVNGRTIRWHKGEIMEWLRQCDRISKVRLHEPAKLPPADSVNP